MWAGGGSELLSILPIICLRVRIVCELVVTKYLFGLSFFVIKCSAIGDNASLNTHITSYWIMFSSGEWCRLFGRHDYFRTLQSCATKGKLRSSRFRSVCWKVVAHSGFYFLAL